MSVHQFKLEPFPEYHVVDAEQEAVDLALRLIDNRDEIVGRQFVEALHRSGYRIVKKEIANGQTARI